MKNYFFTILFVLVSFIGYSQTEEKRSDIIPEKELNKNIIITANNKYYIKEYYFVANDYNRGQLSFVSELPINSNISKDHFLRIHTIIVMYHLNRISNKSKDHVHITKINELTGEANSEIKTIMSNTGIRMIENYGGETKDKFALWHEFEYIK